jgi:hypothetical protein
MLILAVDNVIGVEVFLKTTKRKNRNGTTVEYLHLVESVRDPQTKIPKPHIIYNFGRADQVDRPKLMRLCVAIGRVCGVNAIDTGEIAGGDDSPGQAGLPDDVTIHGSRLLGPVLLAERLWGLLGIGAELTAVAKREGRLQVHERALFAMVVNRLCDPDSKLGVWERWLDTVHLPSCAGLKLRHLYAAMDLLQRNAESVEKAVFFRTSSLLNLEVDVVFYDTTTVSFSVDEEDDDEGNDGPRKFGKTKEGVWAPMVVVALAVTRDGLPIKSWVFDGNTSDAKTIARVKEDLKGWKLGRALFVADAGMNSAENRAELAKACGTYLLASRVRAVKEIRDKVLAKRGRYTKVSENLHVKEVVIGSGVRRSRYILCFNPREARRQERHRRNVVAELRTKLAQHRNRTATAKWAVKLKASRRYGQYLRINDTNELELDTTAIHQAKRFDGKWVVETNDDTLTMQDAASGYKALLVIERCFRSMKSTQLRMMPVHHRTRNRIEAHVKICVLALLLQRVAEQQCGRPWAGIARDLAHLQATELRTVDHKFWHRNEPEKAARDVLKTFQVPVPSKILMTEPLS